MNHKVFDLLGGLTPEQFLDEYWQKKPLLIRNALPNIENLLEPDEIAGLALEEDIESRIIVERSPVDWELQHGPFSEKTFKNLPQTHWTLLVQALDHYCPPVADLLGMFEFIPSWRIDDVMISYATDGGSVGPHYDYYDVFLIQSYGQRHWRVGQQCDDSAPLIPNLPIRILSEFQMDQDWILNPGDMLYLPPGLAHYGVAVGECMTLSVGFRAPSEQDILLDFVHTQLQKVEQEKRYCDPDLQLQSNPAWISPNAVERMAEIMRRAVSDPEKISLWMGAYLSQTKYDRDPEPPESDYSEEDILELLLANHSVRREESTRMVYTGDAHRPQHFFINGAEVEIPPLTHPLILYLCKQRLYRPTTLDMFCRTPECLQFITQLVNQGILYFEDDTFSDEEYPDLEE